MSDLATAGAPLRVVRVFHHWCSRRKIGLYLAEQSAALASFLLLFEVAARILGKEPHGWALVAAAACAGSIQLGLYFLDLYDPAVAHEDRAEGLRLLRALGLAVMLCALLALSIPRVAPGALLAGVAGAIAAVVAARAGLPAVLGKPDRVLVVGRGPRARELIEAVRATAEFEIAGLAGAEDQVHALAQRHTASVVVVALDDGEALPAESLLACRLVGIPVFDATTFAERALRRLPVQHLRAEELVYADGFRASSVTAFVKRALDLAAAAVLSLLAAPLMLLAAIVIRLDSPGPVFYRQERVGKGGRVFQLTKFRTMRPDAEADGRPVWASQSDDRITRVGWLLRKSRMDELPQVLSVLRGDMSFVGPRPERPYFVEELKKQIPFYGLREAVKPGITGWAQIRYPYGASVEDARAKLEYDLYYLKNQSVFLDLTIIFHTARHVLIGRGAR